MTRDKNQKTQTFSIREEREMTMKEILYTVYEALREKGYDPLSQLVGYIISEDPTYITNHKNARSLIRKLDRDELMEELIRNYLKI
ncbi:MAG: IreB family regulatory phosphoprotein [Ruminococcaceae bacterium]|nr:IreB family regulatory phosphoprotein [Oscillospiraceae bacterium]